MDKLRVTLTPVSSPQVPRNLPPAQTPLSCDFPSPSFFVGEVEALLRRLFPTVRRQLTDHRGHVEAKASDRTCPR